MEAVPRLPMISFELNVTTEVSFGPKLRQYITSFYHEDADTYTAEIQNLEMLRASAVRPTTDVSGVQTLKKYYCQLHFLNSRFPMNAGEVVAIRFGWKNPYSKFSDSASDIQYELMNVLYNIGALHSKLGAADSRETHDGMKMSCTHFQCAAWAFQKVKENHPTMIYMLSAPEVLDFFQDVCLAQAQECILEKSMMDNRKATIVAKVAVQVVDYYKRALHFAVDERTEGTSFSDYYGRRTVKDWVKYLSFKIAYYKCIALLFQGQQSEEQQKMGERVAFYQAASLQLDEARKALANMTQQQEYAEAVAFTSDVVEGKLKAAKNENDFIYHEEVPDKEALQEVKGASLVKGIPFNIHDIEVSGNDIFARLVPMKAHEVSSLYSEKKAQMLRQLGELVECKDQKLAEFMSSLQLDVLVQMRQATGLTQDLVDRAAALSAKPTATQDLIDAMTKLSNSYHEVEAMLNDIQELLKEEEKNEKDYQEVMGKRPPSIIATDLAREASKYKEAHNKASESNQTLHRAMITHVANLKVLAQPLSQLQHQIPSVELPDKNIDEAALHELEGLLTKVEEMKNQRAMLWAQLRESIHNDDITSLIVTRQMDTSVNEILEQELQKHQQLCSLIEQNTVAQENILQALVDSYAKFTNSRRYIQDIISKRSTTISALITSYDSYDDLLAKANKGIEFYNKLESNVSKLLQRIKSASKVQEEEREQILAKINIPKTNTETIVPNPAAPKLKDYSDSMKKDQIPGGVIQTGTPYNTQAYPATADATWPPGVRPAPVGQEMSADTNVVVTGEQVHYGGYGSSVPMNTNSTLSVRTAPDSNMGYMARPTSNTSIAYIEGRDANSPYMYNQVPATGYTQQPNLSHSTQQTNLTHPTQQTNLSHSVEQQQVNHASVYNYQQQVVDEKTLNDRMAALMANSNSDSYAANQYAQYGYNPQTTPTNSSTSYSYPVMTQAYTLTSSYQQVSSNAPSQDNYGISYTTSGMTDSQTYSVVPAQPQVTPAVVYPQQPQVVPQGSNVAFSNVAAYTNYVPHGYGTPGVPISGVNCMSYSTNSYNAQQPPVDDYSYQASTSTYSYGNPITGVSNDGTTEPAVPQYDTNYYTSGGYSDVSMVNNYQYNQNSTYPYYDSYYSAASQTSTDYAQPALSENMPVAQTNEPPPATTKQAKSNIDLLTGLDFSVNQEPLLPQQTISSTSEVDSKQEKEIPKPQVSLAPTQSNLKVPEKVKRQCETKLLEVPKRNLLENPDTFKLFVQEVEKYEKFVETLTTKTLNGPTMLEVKWKEIQDKQEADGQKKSISVARCYPMKNRSPDILPYDYSRVELSSTKDDYINASHVKDITPYTPPFIVTQAPMQSTTLDFWSMIWEYNVEMVVCLLSDNEFTDDIYWPKERGQDLIISNMVISLQNVVVKQWWTERTISVSLPECRESKVLLHLQFTAWPGSLFPTSPAPFVNFVKEVIHLQQQQRVTVHPVVVHCLLGVGRSGLLCLLIPAILDLAVNPTSIPDLTALAVKLSSAKKSILRDREHLKFAFQAFLQHLKDLQSDQNMKKDQPLATDSEVPPVKTETEENSLDPLNSLDPFWASKK